MFPFEGGGAFQPGYLCWYQHAVCPSVCSRSTPHLTERRLINKLNKPGQSQPGKALGDRRAGGTEPLPVCAGYFSTGHVTQHLLPGKLLWEDEQRGEISCYTPEEGEGPDPQGTWFVQSVSLLLECLLGATGASGKRHVNRTCM